VKTAVTAIKMSMPAKCALWWDIYTLL